MTTPGGKQDGDGRFANLVASMKHHHAQNGTSSQDRQVEKGRKPSKGLPDTGLAEGADQERVEEHRRASEDKWRQRRQSTIEAKDVVDPHPAPPSHFTDGPGVLPSETSRIPDARNVPNSINFPKTESPTASDDEDDNDTPKETTQKRTRENTLPAENGARPETLVPAKDEEEKPGNRNEIWLQARGGDLHVSSMVDVLGGLGSGLVGWLCLSGLFETRSGLFSCAFGLRLCMTCRDKNR
jgi:hypothetical protein